MDYKLFLSILKIACITRFNFFLTGLDELNDELTVLCIVFSVRTFEFIAKFFFQ